jgi:hypothetical protein
VVNGGDSGAPVFVPYDATHPQLDAVMVGIHSSTDQYGYRYLSGIPSIDATFSGAFYYY